MNVIGYCALHYGLPYLEWSIRSVIDYVDQFYVLYSPHGSHNGNRGTRPPIDSEADLYTAAQRGAGNKLVWIEGDWSLEGQQRDTIYQVAPDADVILVVDSDEVWPSDFLETAIRLVCHSTTQRWRVPIIHFWRSFYRAIPHDPAFPIRIIKPHAEAGERTLPTEKKISHFGYALPPEYIAYKWGGIHGHQAELRKDVDWLKDVYIANRQVDCHPVGSTFWNPERVDPLDFMPKWMESHPYYFKDVIE